MAKKKIIIAELEQKTAEPDFWSNPKQAQKISQELSELKDVVSQWENYQSDIKHLEEVGELFKADQSEALAKEFKRSLELIEQKINKEEVLAYLSGQYDKNNAVVGIYAGAGGTDAQDWAEILLRMYLKYFDRVGFKTKVIAVTGGQEAGLKNAIIEARGKYAYGYLKGESGVHRLVRLSPFSSQNLRHTSFALVEVMPELEDVGEIEINPRDIRVDTYKAGGPGGQYVNKTESAVRLTHLPTGIVTTSQAERSQGANKDTAMKVLAAKIKQRLIQEHKQKAEDLKGESVPIEWSRQIRSYVLHPYKMVKDHRTGYETTQAEAVLEGNLEDFIEAELRALSTSVSE